LEALKGTDLALLESAEMTSPGGWGERMRAAAAAAAAALGFGGQHRRGQECGAGRARQSCCRRRAARGRGLTKRREALVGRLRLSRLGGARHLGVLAAGQVDQVEHTADLRGGMVGSRGAGWGPVAREGGSAGSRREKGASARRGQERGKAGGRGARARAHLELAASVGAVDAQREHDVAAAGAVVGGAAVGADAALLERARQQGVDLAPRAVGEVGG
jgi:hypothetical protein